MYSVKEIILTEDWDSVKSTFAQFHLTLILKYSSTCAKSHTIKYEISEWLEKYSSKVPMQLVQLDVKKRPEISEIISSHFSVSHASPQLIIVNTNGTATHFDNQYDAIDLILTFRF